MSCGVDLCPAGSVGSIAVPEAAPAVIMKGGAYSQPGMGMDPYGCGLAQRGGGCPCNNRMYGGGCSTCLNSMLGRVRSGGSVRKGGYRATKRDKAALKRWRQGKSIGFTMTSSLKAKGLIPRANGTRRISNKYKKRGN